MGLVLIGAGLFVLANPVWVADRVGAYVTPPPTPGSNLTGSGYSEGYFQYLIWGSGLTMIGSGGAILRSAFTTSFAGARGGGLVGQGMAETDLLDEYMERAMSSSARTVRPPPAKEVVRIKCRNCGSLEVEDATYCRKCGQPL
jgi:predicted RNA-binding Zn-ribbon protein involved in translation (DUF1610 family)